MISSMQAKAMVGHAVAYVCVIGALSVAPAVARDGESVRRAEGADRDVQAQQTARPPESESFRQGHPAGRPPQPLEAPAPDQDRAARRARPAPDSPPPLDAPPPVDRARTVPRDGKATRRAPVAADTVRRPDAGGTRVPPDPSAAPTIRSQGDADRSVTRRAAGIDGTRRAEDPGEGARSTGEAAGTTGRVRSVTRSPIDANSPPPSVRRSPSGTRSGSDVARSITRPAGAASSVRTPVVRERAAPVSGTRQADPRTVSPRSIERSNSAGAAGTYRGANDRPPSARVRDRDSVRARTVARGSIDGRDVYVRGNRQVSAGDVRVYNVGHHGSGGGNWRHHDDGRWWRHGERYHHTNFCVSFTYVHSYFAPAHAVVYDVVPVAPVIVAPAPVFSASFAYYSCPAVVSVSSVRYVYPVATVAPAVVVYREFCAPPIITPVVFSPVVTTPVYAAPVVVPVVAPVYAPVYYYYPACTVLRYPAYYVEPAPVVAAPAVVETPSRGWSISGAFGFTHNGQSYSFGGGYTKVKSEPVQVVAPAGAAEAAEAPDPGAPAAPAEQVSLDAGLAAIRAGDMEQARRVLSQVVVNDPGDGVARMLYVCPLMTDGQYRDAAEAVRRALETWADVQLKDFYLPSVYEDAGRFTRTMRDVREFLSDHPERVDAWLLAAFCYTFSGEPEQARMLLDEAGRSWPDDPGLETLQKITRTE